MFDGSSSAAKVALAAGLLLLAPLAGCLEPLGETAQDAVRDGNPPEEADQETSEETRDGQLKEGDVTAEYETAFSSVEPGNETLERVSMDMHVDEKKNNEAFDASLYWNARDKIAVMTFLNGTPSGGSGMQGDAVEGLLFGTVNRTTFIGVPPELMSDYNESGSWDEEAFNLSDVGSETSQTGTSSEDSFDVSTLLDNIDELPDDANVTWSSTTYEGHQAHEIEVQHENETAFIDVRALIDQDSERPLLFEGTFENATTNRTYMEISFAYGDDADHEYAEELLRLEAMAIVDEDDNRSLIGGSNETQNWTVQPSQNPGLIALEEVEVHLRSSGSDPSSDTQAEVTLPAEDGRIVTEDAKLVYEDEDGDGAVSPGDRIQFTPLSEEAQSWGVYLHDEETEMRTTPGVGLLGALAAAIGALGLLAPRRRSG